MKFRPLHDRVALARIDGDQKTPGGIIIPDTAKEKSQEGRIVAVGLAGRDEIGKLIPGRQMVGHRDQDPRVEYLIMKESDILGVLTEAEAKAKAA